MHKCHHAISITFIRENIKPAMFLRVFGGPHGPGCGAELGSLYACIYLGSLYVCIYSGGQMGKFTRLKYATFVTPGSIFYYISTRFRPLLKNAMRLPHICDTCHFSATHVIPASDIYDICGDYMALALYIYIYVCVCVCRNYCSCV